MAKQLKTEQAEPRPVAVCVADLHLSSKPPAARSGEKDWLRVQAGYLDQLRRLAVSPTGEQRLICLVAGDFFDRYDTRADAVNVALSHLPHCHGIPGQHDLPNHNYKQIRRSSFWTLVKAGKVTPLEPGTPVEVQAGGTILRLHGFPWGFPVKPLREPHDLALEVAVIHAFLYTRKTGYEGAPKEQHVYQWEHRLKGYGVAVFGDNHCPFSYRQKDNDTACRMHNCGGFLRRRINEIDHRPSASLLYSDGTVKRHFLDVSHDRFITDEQAKAGVGQVKFADFDKFLESLAELGDAAIDFADRLRRMLDHEDVTPEIKQLILSILEEEKCGRS